MIDDRKAHAGRTALGIALRVQRFALVIILLTLSAGCGFHLRGQASLPFDSVYITGSPVFVGPISRALRAGSAVRIATDPKDAQVTLQILSELRERVILSLSATGRVRELTLRYRVSYRLTDANGSEYIPPSEIVLRRDITYSDTDVLGKEQEEALLYRDMQSDAVQQVVRRLQIAKIEVRNPAPRGEK